MTISVSPARVTRLLALAVSALVMAGIASVVGKYALGEGWMYGVVQLFDLDAERTLASWHSSSALLVAAGSSGSSRAPSGGARAATGGTGRAWP